MEIEQRPALGRHCASRDELWNWLDHHLNLRVPRSAVCQGHDAPFDYLWSAYREPAKDQVVWAPRGGGKTRLGAAATLLDLLHKPGVSVRILGGSLEQSLRMWEHLLGDLQIVPEPDLDGSPGMRRVRFASGSAAAVLTQSQRSVRGQRVQKMRCDEVEMFDPRVWSAAQLTTRSLRSDDAVVAAGVVEAFSTMHKSWGLMRRIVNDAHARGARVIKWCLMEVLAKCPPERDCISCPLLTECQGRAKTRCEGFLGIDDAIALKGRVSDLTWRTEMLCHAPSDEGLVFGSFDPSVHVVDCEPPADGRWTLAVDFGYANPFVCLWVVESGTGGADDEVLVVDEHHRREWTVEQHLAHIATRPWPKTPRVACDPAGGGRNDQTAESNIALLRRSGHKVHARRSQIVDGVELVRTALRSADGRVRLRIHRRCRNLIAALQSYHYAEGGGENPVKDGVSDHALDALRYFFINRPRWGTMRRREY